MPQTGQRANVRNYGFERAGIFVLLVAGRGDIRCILRDGIGQRRDLRGLDAGQNVLRRPVANDAIETTWPLSSEGGLFLLPPRISFFA